DFPTTLDERTVRLEAHAIEDSEGITREQVPIDLRSMTLQDALAGRVPTDRPVLVIWEGMSMYFQEEDVTQILKDIGTLMTHPDSLLWVDMVDREPVVNPSAFPESIQNFMRGMQI